METSIIKSDMVTNRMVQDKGNKIQVVGSKVEALYPSLEAVEVTEIVYEAVLKTKLQSENIDLLEGGNYIALTSTEQECRLGPIDPRESFPGGVAIYLLAQNGCPSGSARQHHQHCQPQLPSPRQTK